MENCLFCKIIHKEIPADIVYDDEDTIAFLDIHPVNIGHVLVIPKKHIENIYGFDEDNINTVFTAVQKTARAVKGGVNADGINIIMSNEKAAGQEVFHAHVHIIPRYETDNFAHWKRGREYEEGEAETVAVKISSQL